MKSIPRIIATSVLSLLGLALFGASTAQAADATWNVNAAGNWATGASWLPTAAPGATTGTTNADTATFGTVISLARIVTVDANRNIFGINFAGNSSAYTLSGGNLLLTDGGLIQTSGGGSGHTDTISSAIAIQGNAGAATFTAGSSTAGRLLSIGAVTGVSAAANTTTLTLNGTNTGNNLVGAIGNGAGGGNLAVVKSDAGTWRLSGSNTFTGGLTLNAGVLSLGDNAALGGVGNVFTIAGGSLNVSAARTTTNNNAQNWNGDFTFVGSNTLNLGTGAVTLNASRDVTVSASTLTVGGAIGDGGSGFSLTKSGVGTMILNGTNTFSGATVINSGTLRSSTFANVNTNSGIGRGSVGGSAADLVFGGGTLLYNTAAAAVTDRLFTLGNAAGLNGTIDSSETNVANSLSFTGTGAIAFGGSGARTLTLAGSNGGTNALASILGDGTGGVTTLTKSGAGTWVVSGSNNYTGGTNINGGTLTLGSEGALGTSGTISFGGGSLQFSGSNSTDYSNRFSNAAGQAYSINTNNQSVILATALTSSGGSLSKAGLGTLTLTASNSYDGGTSVSGGTLILNGGNNTLSTAGNISISNANTVLDLGGNTQTTSGTVTFSRGTVQNGTISSSGAYLANLSGITISANLTGTAGLTVTAGANNTINLSGSNNTYSGGTMLSGSSLVTVSNANSLGNGSVVFNGAALGLASGTATLSNAMTALAGQNYRFDVSGLLTIEANLAGDATNGLSKIGTSTLTLTGSNTYGGVTSIGRGVLGVTSLQNGGTASSIGNSSSDASNLFIGSTTASNPMTLAYVGTTAASTDRLFTAVSGTTGSTIMNAATDSAHTLTFSNPGAIAFSGSGNRTIILSGSNTGDNRFAPLIGDNAAEVSSFTKNGVGKWIVTGTNTYTGVTSITAGTLSVASLANGGTASNIGQSSNAATSLLLGNGATLLYTGGATDTDRLFTINGSSAGHSATINASGTGALNLTNSGSLAYGTTAQTRTLFLAGTNTGNNKLAATLANNGASAVSVTKVDIGTWVLTGNNTYTGATTVSAGTLVLNGTTSAGSVVSVTSGAVLAGSGTIGGASNITGSLRPGNSIGTLNSGTTTWLGAVAGGVATDWVFELGASNTADLLNITGNFTKNITLGSVFRFDFAGSTELGTFKLVDWSETTTFLATDFTLTNLGGGNTGTFGFNGSQLELLVVPEPTTALLLGFGLGSALLLRRRRLA